MYGIETPSHDPTVMLTNLSYSPPGPAHPGDTLVFTVTANKAFVLFHSNFYVKIGPLLQPVDVAGSELISIFYDTGTPSAGQANDGIYSTQITLPASGTPQNDTPVSAVLQWLDGYPAQELAGPPLDIVEEQE